MKRTYDLTAMVLVCALAPSLSRAQTKGNAQNPGQSAVSKSGSNATQNAPHTPPPVAAPSGKSAPGGDVDMALMQRLESTRVDANYDRVDLSKIIDDLRQRYDLNIHVNWSALENSHVRRDTRIEVQLKQ